MSAIAVGGWGDGDGDPTVVAPLCTDAQLHPSSLIQWLVAGIVIVGIVWGLRTPSAGRARRILACAALLAAAVAAICAGVAAVWFWSTPLEARASAPPVVVVATEIVRTARWIEADGRHVTRTRRSAVGGRAYRRGMDDGVPRSERPTLPDGYGLPPTTEGTLGWDEVERRLVESTVYWLATTRPDGRPHVMPRWGVWVDRRLWYDGSPATRHARNLRQNPACVLHLESGTEVVIVEGESRPTRADADGLGTRIAEAFGKYHGDGYAPAPDAWAGDDGGGLAVFTPATALAWFSFPSDATRFRFGSG